jgi:hypothetical protein
MPGTLAIKTSRRFRDAQDGLGPGLRGKVIGAVHDFVRRYEADRRTAAMGYDRLAHMSTTRGDLLDTMSLPAFQEAWRTVEGEYQYYDEFHSFMAQLARDSQSVSEYRP